MVNINTFLESLKSSAAITVDYSKVNFGKNTYRFRQDVEGIATLHLSTKVKQFWGLADNVIQRLLNQNEDWAAILVDSDLRSGYIIPSHVIEEGIISQRWSTQKKSGLQYKFQQPKDFLDCYRFRSIEEMIGILKVLFCAVEK